VPDQKVRECRFVAMLGVEAGGAMPACAPQSINCQVRSDRVEPRTHSVIGLKIMAVLMESHKGSLNDILSQTSIVQISAKIVKQFILMSRD
jgi:hypothetical protein